MTTPMKSGTEKTGAERRPSVFAPASYNRYKDFYGSVGWLTPPEFRDLVKKDIEKYEKENTLRFRSAMRIKSWNCRDHAWQL